jgi:oxygen-independent coproporphyrinogen-3 oxidase
MGDLSLYVHIPFCNRRCPYCSFYHVPASPGGQAAFVEALEEEVRTTLGRSHPRIVLRTVYIGGGTPSVLGESSWERIFSALGPYVRDGVTEEITCELNPEDVSGRLVDFLAEKGVNRVSLGVQSMDPSAQKTLKRCPPATNTKAIADVKKRFSNVGFDVLVGIPGSTTGALERSMVQLAQHGPAHFSVYCLEPGGGAAQGANEFFSAVDQDRSADEYLYVCDYLGGLGYRHYELSNFALPGWESVHNRCYWEGREYVGMGPAAHSFVDGTRFSNPPSLQWYLSREWEGSEDGRVYDTRDRSAVEIEQMMLALRTARGMPLEWARCRDDVIRDIITEGLARIESGRLMLTDRGYLVMNDVLLRLRAAAVAGDDRGLQPDVT